MAAMAFLAWGADTTTAPVKKTQGQKTSVQSTLVKKSSPKTVVAGNKPSTGVAAPAARKSTSSNKTPASRTTASRTPASKTSSSRTSATARRGGRPAPVTRVTWRNRQMAPSTDRYREIQNALVAKGYLKPEDASGAWNQASVDGLKKFQSEQNLESTGKINSLSLIALGLGPKHETASMPVKVPPNPVQEPPALVQQN